MSWELNRLSKIENEYKNEYELLSEQCQEYASALVNETRTTDELKIILNYDHLNPHEDINENFETNNLSRLKLAVRFKQKKVYKNIYFKSFTVGLLNVS